MEIRGKLIGVNNLEYTYYLSNLALLYIATGRLNEAMDTTKQIITITNDLMGHIFSITSERQRMAFIGTYMVEYVLLFLSLVVRYYST